MAITRITAVWTGFQGAPGYTNFFFNAFGGGDEVNLEQDRVRSFFNALTAYLPSDVEIQVQQEASILDETSGELIGYAIADDQATVVRGSNTGDYASPVGVSVTWNTGAVARGRRLRGRTFLVPLAGSAFDTDGTPAGGTITGINTAAGQLLGDGSGPQLVIWSRPRDGAGGSIGTVDSYRVADTAAVLRSRRD